MRISAGPVMAGPGSGEGLPTPQADSTDSTLSPDHSGSATEGDSSAALSPGRISGGASRAIGETAGTASEGGEGDDGDGTGGGGDGGNSDNGGSGGQRGGSGGSASSDGNGGHSGNSGGNGPVLRLSGLTKHYQLRRLGRLVGRVEAVRDLDLVVPKGSIFGFLGPNGAGKTTTILCACGMLAPDAGSIEVAGYDLASEPSLARARIGYLPEAIGLYPHLDAEQTLGYYGSFYDLDKARLRERATHLLEIFGLADRAREKVAGYSLGMRKRLALATALIHDPELLILDEPTSGLDPQGVRALRQLLRDLNGQGLTIFFSSHVLHEVSQLCDHVAILNEGRLVAQGSQAELEQRLAGLHSHLEVHLRNLTPPLERALRELPGVASLQVKPLASDLHALDIELTRDISVDLNRLLLEHGALVLKLAPREVSLEELFMAFTSTPQEADTPDSSDSPETFESSEPSPAVEDSPAPSEPTPEVVEPEPSEPVPEATDNDTATGADPVPPQGKGDADG